MTENGSKTTENGSKSSENTENTTKSTENGTESTENTEITPKSTEITTKTPENNPKTPEIAPKSDFLPWELVEKIDSMHYEGADPIIQFINRHKNASNSLKIAPKTSKTGSNPSKNAENTLKNTENGQKALFSYEKTAKIADIGAGFGSSARRIAGSTDSQVWALEISPEIAKIARFLTEKTGLARKISHQTGDFIALMRANPEKCAEIREKSAENGEKTAPKCEKSAPKCEKSFENCEKSLENREKSLENGEKCPETAVFPGESAFDAVISLLVFLHIRDKTALFAGISRILRPGGRVFFHDFAFFDPKNAEIAENSPENGAKITENAENGPKNTENGPKNTKNTENTENDPQNIEKAPENPEKWPEIPENHREMLEKIVGCAPLLQLSQYKKHLSHVKIRAEFTDKTEKWLEFTKNRAENHEKTRDSYILLVPI
jgi:SAM-dependent methyltransferase